MPFAQPQVLVGLRYNAVEDEEQGNDEQRNDAVEDEEQGNEEQGNRE